MTYMDIQAVIQVATFITAIISGIYAWITGRDKATQKELRDLRDDLQNMERRISRAESEMAHLPDKESVHRVELAVSGMRGDLRTISESWKPVGKTVQRLEEFLLEMGNSEPARRRAPR